MYDVCFQAGGPLEQANRHGPVDTGPMAGFFTGGRTDISENQWQCDLFPYNFQSFFKTTCCNEAVHFGDVHKRRTGSAAGGFAVAYVVAEQQFKRFATGFVNLVGMRLNVHPFLYRIFTGRQQTAAIQVFDHAYHAGCMMRYAFGIAESRNGNAKQRSSLHDAHPLFCFYFLMINL